MYYLKYRWRTGMWAWALHRLTGLALVFYLVLHLYVTHYLALGPEKFNKVMNFLSHPLFKLGEIALVAAILYHGLNGLRVTLIDLVLGIEKQKVIFWILMITGILIFIPMAIHLFPFK